MSTLAELEAAGHKAAKIRAALDELKRAQDNLDLLNKHRPDLALKDTFGSGWNVELMLEKGNANHFRQDRTVKIYVPFAVAQQQLVYAVDDARRKIIALGGELPGKATVR